MEIAGEGWSEQVRFMGASGRARAFNCAYSEELPRESFCQISIPTTSTIKSKTQKMKTKNSFLCGATLFLGAALFHQSVQAQLTLSGTNYTQNFDAISNGLPAGWSVRIDATTNSLGTVTNLISAKKT